VTVGANTTVHAGVHIYDGVSIGKNVILHSGCVIGGDGFGFERMPDGPVLKFPHIGSVIIEDDVELCGQCHVARGTLKDTIIRKGVKVDGICHIAHNVEIGEHTMVAANTMFSGGVTVGARSWIGPSTSVIDRVRLGDDIFTGIATVVTKNLPAGSRVMGSPARPVDEYKRWLQAVKTLGAPEDAKKPDV
jgi:UDP-3-O-[3-hydroxymyristoyl] glucosamine N-acyltransferase